MELSLFQGCATPPVHFFPPYVQPTFPLLQISAVASWSFHRWLHPFSSQTSGGEGQQLSSPFACSVCAAQIGITTLVGLWYQLLLPPHPRSFSISGTPRSPLILVCTKSSQGSRSWEAPSSSWLQGHLGTKMLVSATFAVWSTEFYKVWAIESCTSVPFTVSPKCM